MKDADNRLAIGHRLGLRAHKLVAPTKAGNRAALVVMAPTRAMLANGREGSRGAVPMTLDQHSGCPRLSILHCIGVWPMETLS
eukprot:584753-Prymnesium_polylepis.1